MTELTSAMSGVFGALSVTGLVALWLRGREAKVTELSHDVRDLRDREVKGIATKLDEHIGADQSQAHGTKLETLIAQNNEQLLELKKLNREGAAQGQTMMRNEKSLNNVWEKFDQHRQDRDIHHA